MAERQLILIGNPALNEPADFEDLARQITRCDDTLDVKVISDRPAGVTAQADTPTLTVSPVPVRWFRPPRGPLLQGRRLSKSTEYRALEARGVRVPRWYRLTPTNAEHADELGPYVVVKPDLGARGADVRIVRASHVHWSSPRTGTGRSLGGVLAASIVQEFVYTGPWPVSYRVATLFGEALFCLRIEASHTRPPLPGRHGFREVNERAGVSIVSSGKGCSFELVSDVEVIALAERAHSALPDVPLLGVDVLRDSETCAVYVIELNSLGYTWHFSSPAGRRLQAEFGIDLDAQFGGRRKAARILAEQTRLRAR